jgi:hypothetical protein
MVLCANGKPFVKTSYQGEVLATNAEVVGRQHKRIDTTSLVSAADPAGVIVSVLLFQSEPAERRGFQMVSHSGIKVAMSAYHAPLVFPVCSFVLA